MWLPARHPDRVAFFFRTADVRMVDVQDWQEVKLATPKAAAIGLFRSRRPLLGRTCGGSCWFVRRERAQAGSRSSSESVRYQMGYAGLAQARLTHPGRATDAARACVPADRLATRPTRRLRESPRGPSGLRRDSVMNAV